ncbi:MAG: AAA family ATPase, partial [SAR324 cluster bacterium]|nr:AAA family ATPase [SAR324 cluster bacterium]
MNERLDPEEVQGLMRRLKERAVEIVEAHGGIVSQFVGDEVLGLFGIPTAHEDDPLRAVRAAQGLHELARQMSSEVEGKIGRPLRMHTGIDSGLVVTSTADSRDGTIGVTGDTVNVAARLKAAAEDDAILVSPETQHQVADFFNTEPLDAAQLKGKAEAVTPYRVIGATAVDTRFAAAEARGLTAYTGRDREMAQLNRSVERAMKGEGQFVTVMGEAGVGKSRLLYEFRNSLDREQVTVTEGRCQIHGTETSYLPFLDGLRRGLRLLEEDSAAELAQKAVANILAIDPALERYVPHYLHLLSIPSEAHPMPRELQGEALRRAFEEAIAAITTFTAAAKPMVLIYEDWHWADEASDSALKNLIGLLSGYPLMLVVLYRPEYTRAWSNPDNYTPLVLKPLGEANTEAIAKSIFGAEQLPEGLAAAIHGRTEGNPFFTEEICNALNEDRSVTVADNMVALARPLEDLHLPDTIQAVIRSRV